MGCHVTKNANSDNKIQEQKITNEMLHEFQVDEDAKSRISVYNQAIEKMQKIPKLRNAIFNPIVQRRKMQKFEED